MHITVAICTWNRADLLDQTLAQMGQLVLPPGVEWELLVVNNNGTDHTDEVIARHTDRLPLRRLFEPTSGKSHAANLAIAEARGELVLWADDDVLVAPDWLAHFLATARAYPDATFFGGTVDPLFEVEPPRWIARNIDHLQPVYAIIRRGEEVRPLADTERVNGASMAIRREAALAFPFDTRLGPSQLNQVRYEEFDLQDRMVAAGHHGVWVGPAKVRHFIPAHRLTERFVRDWYEGKGRTEVRYEGLPTGPYLFDLPRWAIRAYLTATLESRILGLDRGLLAFTRAAHLRGILAESRRLRRAIRESPTGPAISEVPDREGVRARADA